MDKLTWYEYLEGFESWSDAEQEQNVFLIESLEGAYPDDVMDIAFELNGLDERAINRLLELAVEAKLSFDCDNISDMYRVFNKDIATKAAFNSVKTISSDEFELLEEFMTDEDLIKLYELKGIKPPEYLRKLAKEQKKLGFFARLFSKNGK